MLVCATVGHASGDKGPIECVACGAAVDRRRDPARVVSGRIAHICRACAGLGAHAGHEHARASSQSACARCGREVPLYEARPVPGADGRIALACVACAEARSDDASDAQDQPDAIRDTLPEAPPAWRRQPAALLALAVAVLLAVLHLRGQVPPRAAAADSLRATTAALAGPALADPALADPALAVSARDPRQDGAARHANAEGEPVLDDPEHDWLEDIDPSGLGKDGELPPTIEDMRERNEPLEELLPTLADWVFPVLGSDEPFPLKPTRRFGADRNGRAPAECGEGHCGVDLDGPRGTPVVAVAWGVVTRVERRGHRSSGKYVSIEHPDYVYTAYMHLDDVADGLEVGDEVSAGDVIGTLGRTGIRHSAPHLHFTLAVPSGSKLVHLDPTPYLDRAERLRAR
jgi:murein DD-endopeptidase MepM/ murein hydrolase activator NlpD